MAFDRAALQALAESVGDGVPVEWDAIEAQAPEDQRPVIRQLRVLESLANLHRSLPTVPGEEAIARAPERPLSAPAIGNWGHLALIERLGGGTYGEVYRAWDRQLERDVALKVLRGETTDSGRLLAEGRLLARIRHQNVVSVYGVDTRDGRVGLWMELVRGVTLEQLVASQGPFSAREAALVGIDLCRALAAIHAAGLVHRDVKAQNVMREDGGRIVLMDLGTGRDVGRGEVAAGLAGTPLYLAPEIFEGSHASERTDVYSLGVLLYHLVTGEYPVRAGSFNDLQQAHAAGRVVRLRDERPDLPSGFVAAVDRALAADPAARYQGVAAFEADLVRALEPPAAPEIGPKRSPFRDPRYLALAAMLVAAIGIGAYFWPSSWQRTANPGVAAGAIRSIAVLPLKNDSGDPAQEYFADGMTDEIISTLGRLDGLTVISRTSSTQFKGLQFNGARTTLPEIAQRLKADAIVEGSVLLVPGGGEKGGHKVRITARLIAAGTDAQIWNQTFESVADDIIELEGRVARAIAEGIKFKLSAEQQGALLPGTQAQPQDFETYNLYLRGRYYWNLRTKEDMNRSLEFFQQAIQRDPRYALAHSGLADAYTLLGTYGALPIAEASAKAFAAASRAVTLDDSLAEAHASLGLVHDDRLQWEAAEASFQRALALKPGYARAHHWYAAHLMRMGRFDEATRAIRQAMTLDPLSPSVEAQLAAALFLSRRYDDEIAHLENMLKTNGSFARAHRLLGEGYAKKGDFARALAALKRAEELGDTSADRRAYEGAILALAGRSAEARKTVQELIERYRRNQDGGPVGVAVVYANLGDADRTFEWLQRGLQLSDPWIGFLNVDPWFDPVRKDPRFARLLASAGLTR